MPDILCKIKIHCPEVSFQDLGNIQHRQGRSTGRKASLTLEAALTVPLFLLALVAVICMMDVYRIQAEVKTSLSESARELGMYAAAAQGDGKSSADTLSTAACILYSSQKLPEMKDHIRVSLLRSAYRNHTVILQADIFYTLPVGVGPWKTILLKNMASAGAWVGNGGEREWSTADNSYEEMVYITETESVYHTSSACTHIRLSVHAGLLTSVARMRNDYGECYESCSKCNGEASAGTVYYTEKGDCYHSDPGCSSLKRTVRLVKKTEAEGKSMCTRCRQREEQK